MVDKVAITAGVGTDVATDDCGAAGHAQVMKLAVSNDGVATLLPADGTAGLKVDLGADNDITGTVTANAGTNLNTSLLALEAGGNLAAIATSLAALDNAVAGNEFQVDVLTLPALPAGNNNIGDVDIVTMPNIVVSTLPAITGTGTFVVQVDGAALTSFQLSDDVVTVLGSSTYTEGTTKGTLIGGVRHDADTSLVGTDNETAPFQLDARGLVKVEAFSGEALPVTDNAGSLSIDWNGTQPVTGSGTATGALRVELANNGTGVLATVGAVTNITNAVTVNAHAVTNAGTFAVQASVVGSALTALEIISSAIYVDDTGTHATGTSKVMLIGAAATPTDAAVNANDIGAVAMTLNRELFVAMASVTPGTGATNLGKAEDAGHTTGDVGVMYLGVVNSANAAMVNADLDYCPISLDTQGNQNVLCRAPIVRVSVQDTGVTTSTTAYTAGDQMGKQFIIAGASRATGGSGYITGVQLISAADNIGAVDVVFFDASVSVAADNAAFVISDAYALQVVQLVNLAGSYDIGNNRIAQAQNIRIPYVCNGGTSLYAALITRAGHTFFGASTDLTLVTYLEPS